jgi:large subunit ribosomal protein L31
VKKASGETHICKSELWAGFLIGIFISFADPARVVASFGTVLLLFFLEVIGFVSLVSIFAAHFEILFAMKQGIHPENYRFVVFKDMSNEYTFLSKSTANSKETIKWEDGNEYPLIKMEISHTSHPFYTGKMQLVDTAGRIDKFKTRYAKFDKKK